MANYANCCYTIYSDLEYIATICSYLTILAGAGARRFFVAVVRQNMNIYGTFLYIPYYSIYNLLIPS